jgi:ubiquinol-cytochrome c reductase cytochrome b subunit
MKQSRVLRSLDERLGFASVARSALAKIFPDHWSFMLGEIAMYSFIILVATGVYLTAFFDGSSAEKLYMGKYAPMHGEMFSAAYASTVSLSWDVRGGLLMRQAHHWAAHIFIGAIVLHMCRIFFTGMFRKPRELNWMVGLTLLVLAIFNAFAGYSLPDDLLSGTGLHIFYGIMLSIPLVGAWLAFLVFGGEFPGGHIIERLYALHIFVVPAVIALLLAVHLGVLIKQKHSHFSGPGRRDSNVVGSRVWPSYALRSFALLCAVCAATFLAGGLFQINPIWQWGDFKSPTILSPSVADWYILWVEGALRMFPPVNVYIFGHLIPDQFWPGVFLPALTFAVLYAWPWIDRRLTGDRGTHHITGRPRQFPLRTGIGLGALTFYGMLLVAGSEELIVEWTHAPIGEVRSILRVLVCVLPFVVGGISYGLARALRRTEREQLLQLTKRDLAESAELYTEEEEPPVSSAPAVAQAERELEEGSSPAEYLRSGEGP